MLIYVQVLTRVCFIQLQIQHLLGPRCCGIGTRVICKFKGIIFQTNTDGAFIDINARSSICLPLHEASAFQSQASIMACNRRSLMMRAEEADGHSDLRELDRVKGGSFGLNLRGFRDFRDFISLFVEQKN